jgi:hypothetical protein
MHGCSDALDWDAFFPFPLWSYQILIYELLAPVKVLSAAVSKLPDEKPISIVALSLLRRTWIAAPV